MSSNSTWTAEYAAEYSSQPLLNVCISFAILETFFIISFIFSWYFNRSSNSNPQSVFYLILVGYMFCFGGVILGTLKITDGGAGYHEKTLRPKQLQSMLQLVKAHEFVYIASIPPPKLAILLLYRRLFPSKMSRYLLYVTALIIIATFFFGLISAFANCRPFSAFWNRKLHARCTMDIMTVFRYYSIPNLISDVILLIIPIPALRRLHVGLLTKIGVYLTFLTMTFGIVTAALRFVSFLDVNVFEDITYLCTTTTSWTIIEPGVYLVAATMPTLRPLIRRIFREAGGVCSPTNSVSSCFRQSVHARESSESVAQPPILVSSPRPILHKKQSSKSLHREFFETIGQKPSRTLQLDSADYHFVPRSRAIRPRSIDEESMVCADASTQERFAREDRNPDGTLRTWSLQPVHLSPLRTSFVFGNN